jgi:integrase
MVPVHPETQHLLERYLRRRGRLPGPLFMGRIGHTSDRDGRLTTQAIRDVMKRAAKATGVDVSPHQLRRGFVAQYLRASRGDVLGLEVIGGWSDHRMPRRYLADEEAEAGIDRYFDVVDAAPDELGSRRGRRA